MKPWKIWLAAMTLALAGCGGGGGGDDKTPPSGGDNGPTVPTPPPPAGVDPDNNPKITVAPTDIAVAAPDFSAEGSTTVNFSLGNATFDASAVEIASVSATLVKLMPGRNPVSGDPSFWKAFVYSSSGKATSDKGTYEQLANGTFSYTFATDVKNVTDPYPADSVHNNSIISLKDPTQYRVSLIIQFVDTTKQTVTLVNNWIPTDANATPSWTYDAADPEALNFSKTRNLMDNSSCTDCHMDKPIKHSGSYGYDVRVCASCHNESNPDSSRRSLATIVHKKHGNLDSADTKDVPHYPQDARNCDTCHKPETDKLQNADLWLHSQEKPCGACHADASTTSGFVSHIDSKIGIAGKECSTCHSAAKDDNKAAFGAHLGRMSYEQQAAAKFKLTFDEVRYSTPNAEVAFSVSNNGEPAQSLSEATQFVSGAKFNLLLNWDKGQGFEVGYSKNKIAFDAKSCEALGGGKFVCRTALGDNVEGTLAATVDGLRVCVARKDARDGTYAAGDLLACDNQGASLAPIKAPTAYFDTTGNAQGEFKLKVGADMAGCESCHSDTANFHAEGIIHAVNDFAQCTSCHNGTRSSFYSGIPGDLKYHVHSYHAVGSKHDATKNAYPGNSANCTACHTSSQINLPNQKNTKPSLAKNADGVEGFYSPTLVVCSSCHLQSALGLVDPNNPAEGDSWASHMQDKGAVFGAATPEEATGREQCAECHAAGGVSGVDEMHRIYKFKK
ncbi:MAG: OmcA/MtrC family decaheme c-type cytochrome [Aeromonas sp.]